ncbi:Similar to Arhgap21: Rho GTPase-activating protein 21 (Mus musculus), partial [Cotesia congregata]
MSVKRTSVPEFNKIFDPIIGHASPPPPAPFSGHQQQQQQQQQDISPPRGPRTLLLRRSENGFGFTLRHFIVYPPESCCEPMDTIFVKQVRANSPAAEAGLRTGDRVVSVDGVPTRGEQYASVVQRIQQAEPWLRLLVVSKDDDFLQKFFGDTAHNPETNQRPARLRSPDKILQKQRRSMSMIPGPSSRARQSWVCQTLPGSENQGTAGSSYRLREEALKDQAANKMTTSVPNIQRRPLIEARNHESMYSRTDDRSQRRSLPQQQDIDINPMVQVYRSPDAKFHLYDRTRSESIYSRPSSEQIYDKIKDPIYERVRPDLNTFSKSLDHQYPMSRAEPQVPIYRPGRRVVTRRASEGSGPINDPEGEGGNNGGGQAYSNNEGFNSGDPGSRLSVESRERQDSSPLSKDSSISSSYDSTSTLTGNECSDDSIMTRLRKSFEQKEEFLRRPSHPIGWLLPDETARINAQGQGVIQREFYARPQKLQRQVWPPNEQSLQNQQQQQQRNNSLEKAKNNKPSNQNLQRVRSDMVESNDVVNNDKNGEREGAQAIRDRFYSSLYDTNQRAKQFESGRLLSDDDEPTSDRTNLYKSELSRLSNKRSVPNVAVRKREFESKAEFHDGRRIAANRESKGLSGNRIIPIGSKYIHCVPPSGYKEDKETPAMDMEPVRLRARSNSAESWEAVNGGTTRRGVRHTWQTEPDDPEGETRNSKAKRQDSYLQAVRNHLDRESHVGQQHETANEEPKPMELNSVFPAALSEAIARSTTASTMPTVTISPPPPVRPNQLPIPNPLRPLDTRESSFNHQHLPSDQQNVDDPESTGSSLAPGSDLPASEVVLRRQKNSQLSDEERATRRVSYLKATWGERMHVDSDLELTYTGDGDRHCFLATLRHFGESSRMLLKLHHYTVITIVTASQIHIVIPHAAPGRRRTSNRSSEKDPFTSSLLYLMARSTDRSWKQVWGVLRGPILYFYKDRHTQSPSATSDSDVGQHVDVRCSLVDVADDYTKRKHVFRVANTSAEVLLQTDDAASMALWLRALHKHAAAEKTLDGNSSTTKQQAVPQTPGPTTPSGSPAGGQRLSPLPGHKGIRKLTSFRNRSPTGQSPVNKTRKPSQTVEPLQSPKSKTWKGRVAKQLRKMHGQAGSPSSPTAQLQPEGATFKVPLELCPVVKLYPMFIDADKIEDPQRRMATIRKLLRDLPEHHFETLKYLMFHLKKVVEHSEINKMEAKNLAIVFGPTLVRASGSRDNMVTMVTDMSHQCRIVESLLNNVDWFFCEEDLDDLSRLSVNLSLPADGSEADTTTNHNLLLNNIQKVEGMREMVSAKDIVSSIISAANRKIQRRRKGQEEQESEDHEDEKTKAKQDESLGVIRQSMALNERQCSVSEMSNDEVAIRTYAGLSATTQERIRRFEQETKAMLQRDQHRQRREAEKREEERRRIEMEWQLAKREMENDDILDGIIDNTVGTPYLTDRLSNLNDRLAERSSGDNGADTHRSKSTTRLTPLSLAVQQQPTARQKALATNQLTSLIGEKINNGIVKKFKTDKESSMESLAPTRYGSLDSLHEVHTSPSPSHQTRGIPGDISDDGASSASTKTPAPQPPEPRTATDPSTTTCSAASSSSSPPLQLSEPRVSESGLGAGPSSKTLNKFLRGSDLLTSLTSTFDRKWKSLVNPSNLLLSLQDHLKFIVTQVFIKLILIKIFWFARRPPDNDRNVHRKTSETSTTATDSSDGGSLLDATEKDENPSKIPIKSKRFETKNKSQENESASNSQHNDEAKSISQNDCNNLQSEDKTIMDSSYSNKLEKFESLSSQANESRSRLKRSESLNKRTEIASSKLKRSESLNKHSDRLASPTNGKLKRSESLNKHAERSESPNMKLKRSESLTKTEKTECNISKRRQSVRKESATKLKRKNGMPERSIKRRHTVGGTKDFDKVHWLDNKLQSETERIIKSDNKPKKSQLRTSSPDLSSNRVNVADASFLIEVSFRGPSNVVFNVTNARPQSLPDANLASKVFK